MKTIIIITIIVFIQILVMEVVRILGEYRKERAERQQQLFSKQKENQDVKARLTRSYLESINS